MNERGLDIGNESITANRDLPWLQDVDGDGDGRSDVWLNSWDFEYRDVVIVDRDSTVIESFNLTRNDLAESDNFEILKSKFIESAATPPASPWQQSIEPLDVDSNGIITPLDALLVINELGKFPGGILPDLGGEAPPSYIDTDGDGFNGPLDALLVINQLTVINDGLAAAAPVAAPLSAPAAPLSATAAIASLPTANETLDDDGTLSENAVASETNSLVTGQLGSRLPQFQVEEFAGLRVQSVSNSEIDLRDVAVDAALAGWDWL